MELSIEEGNLIIRTMLEYSDWEKGMWRISMPKGEGAMIGNKITRKTERISAHVLRDLIIQMNFHALSLFEYMCFLNDEKQLQFEPVGYPGIDDRIAFNDCTTFYIDLFSGKIKFPNDRPNGEYFSEYTMECASELLKCYNLHFKTVWEEEGI